MKTIQQAFQSQSKASKAVEQDMKELKNNYKKLNDLLNKEVSFEEGLKFALAFEGGLSDDEGDTGGLTNLGITHTEYDEYRASKGLSRRSVADISLVEATDIYRNKYWLASGCADTPRRVAISCFDWQVNSGRGMSLLQQTLGGLSVDGIFGPETSNELNSWLAKAAGEDRLLHNYFERRENLYRHWGVGSQRKFLHGWLRRAKALKKYLHVP
ncbi:MAG: hypothetical protein DSM106950_01395 [Stigonema ocellatum SAG 48.90 = DSM 106950]|nr:hypothetical protein [Stigonema ocellatum SAG 48.90 = DSM 106950]